jgi:hypothetical protein
VADGCEEARLDALAVQRMSEDNGDFREAFTAGVRSRGPLPHAVPIDGEEHDFAGLCAEFVDADRKHQTISETMPAGCCRAAGVPQGPASATPHRAERDIRRDTADMNASMNSAPHDEAAADALGADHERCRHDDAPIPATLRGMLAYAYFSSIMGVPEPVPTCGGGGGVGPPASFHWFSPVPYDAEFDPFEHLEAVPPRWAVTMEFDGDGAAKVNIDALNAEDLLNRLVGHCTLNGVPYRIEGP